MPAPSASSVPTIDELYALIRAARDGRTLDATLVIRAAGEVMRLRSFIAKAGDLCDIGRKSVHESGIGRVVALELLHGLIVEEKGITGYEVPL